MKIRWIGHAAFYFETSSGLRVRTDPYDDSIGLPRSSLPADIVTVSHAHFDHNAVETVPGSPRVLDTEVETTISGLTLRGIPSFHDDVGGAKRGPNIIYVIHADGLAIAHLGDLGHIPSPSILAQMGQIDILCIPVGGVYTLDAAGATETMTLIEPKITIPMHYRIRNLTVGVGPLDDFLSGKTNVTHLDELDVTADTLPQTPTIAVLAPRP